MMPFTMYAEVAPSLSVITAMLPAGAGNQGNAVWFAEQECLDVALSPVHVGSISFDSLDDFFYLRPFQALPAILLQVDATVDAKFHALIFQQRTL